jgi:isoleucyl-tRNA synthetase
LHYVLDKLAKLLAPFTPFISEKIFLKLNPNSESVHLEFFPVYDEKKVNEKVLENMDLVRKIVEFGLSLREEAKIKVRQVLSHIRINKTQIDKKYLDIIAEELNVKNVLFLEKGDLEENEILKENQDLKVSLNTFISEELKEEGISREIIRTINQIRKEKDMTINDKVKVYFKTENKVIEKVFIKYNSEIKKSVLAEEILEKELNTESRKIEGDDVYLEVVKN